MIAKSQLLTNTQVPQEVSRFLGPLVVGSVASSLYRITRKPLWTTTMITISPITPQPSTSILSYLHSPFPLSLQHHTNLASHHRYNNTRLVRGYPDISANGVKTLIYYNSIPYLTGGTSASAPTVGSLITLINNGRMEAGKSVVGFINPVLYKNAHVMNDIVGGKQFGVSDEGV